MTMTALKLPEQTMGMDPNTRVWIYQSSRPFTNEESIEIEMLLQSFAKSWTAHNQQLRAAGFLQFNRVIVLMVDETHTSASGCSIDTSTHFIQSLEKKYEVELFNRMLVYYQINDEWAQTNLTDLRDLVAQSKVSQQTMVINPLVQNKSAFDSGFITPAAECWIADFL